jgi:protein involved in polysaccharide export with SLBB domain
MVYVIGEVEKSGGFVLEDRESGSVLQALSLAGGLTEVAGIEQARILRGGEGGAEKRSEGRREAGGVGGFGQAGESRARRAGEASAQSADEGSAQGAREGPAQSAEDSGQSAGRKRGERVEIAVNLKAIMAGESPDVALESEDILFVPRSGKRAAGQAVKRLAIGTLSGIAIWRVGSR